MTHDDIKYLLANDDEEIPSSTFLHSVMEAVEREAAAPEFPWLRALPGLLATTAAVTVAIWQWVDAQRDPAAMALFGEQVRGSQQAC